jgi:hypothetical protein
MTRPLADMPARDAHRDPRRCCRTIDDTISTKVGYTPTLTLRWID